MSSLKTLWVMLIATLDCNLRCVYCYASGGERNIRMEPENSVAYLKTLLEEYPDLEKLYITFFGGEPTLNPTVMQKVVKFCKGLNLRVGFRISTNGMCDDVTWQFLLDNKFDIALSMDGKSGVNNLLRGRSSGLEERIKQLVEVGQQFHIRCTLTAVNIDHFPEAVEWWANLGVKLIHFEVVNALYGRGKNNPIALPPSNNSLVENVEAAIQMAEKKGAYLMHSSWMKLDRPSDWFCSACHGKSLSILPDGKITACYMASTEGELLDNFHVGIIEGKRVWWDTRQAQVLEAINTEAMKTCQECYVRQFCGGGCPAKHLLSTGSLVTPSKEYCERKRALVELALKYIGLGAVHGTKFYGQQKESDEDDDYGGGHDVEGCI